MHLGIDFGTTRTIVAYVDRGNYPVVSFFDARDDAHEYFPSLAAAVDGRLVYGFDALAASHAGAPMLRSFKRLLASPTVGPNTMVTVGDLEVRLLELLTGFFTALRTALATNSNVASQVGADGISKTVISVPAHAHGAQRYLTVEAFRRAGFQVNGLINEPSAAGFEYTHRQSRTINARRTRVLVYDLGGGTFDVSLVKVDGTDHEVIDTVGLNGLGGDDFDLLLAEMALAKAGIDENSLELREWTEVLDECRAAKEALAPQSRRIPLDFKETGVTLRVDDYYAKASELVDRTIDAMAPLIGGLDHDEKPELTNIAGVYLVGGASGLPLVPRMLRERFGRRVHRSPYPAASTAIGLALACDQDAGYRLKDKLSRGFGVFREGDSGSTVQFDPIFSRDETVDGINKVVITRCYRPVHNVGWFRFVEYASLNENNEPKGEMVPFADVIFPFDRSLREREDLHEVPVERTGSGALIEERYTLDEHGIVTVRLTDLEDGYSREYTLETRS